MVFSCNPSIPGRAMNFLRIERFSLECWVIIPNFWWSYNSMHHQPSTPCCTPLLMFCQLHGLIMFNLIFYSLPQLIHSFLWSFASSESSTEIFEPRWQTRRFPAGSGHGRLAPCEGAKGVWFCGGQYDAWVRWGGWVLRLGPLVHWQINTTGFIGASGL
jgi:hypothetical protein